MPIEGSRNSYAPNSGDPTAFTPEHYARKVLFSSNLKDKLDSSGYRSIQFEDGMDQTPLKGSPTPGRPSNLLLPKGKLPDTHGIPATPHLVNDENRGKLLHFFANHELLAAELMALALLKFPDAPLAFRKGLLNTLREEQIHTQWYLKRMKECGVSFGDYPVSRFFWDSVSGMETPVDYVSRLSLTFEQANLDYSLHYAGILEEAGDPTSAAILRHIYKDEIAHVGYGLKWFRKWKQENGSDWSAYRERLVFPLSPVRAKGNKTPFNRVGRIEAGFTEDYIDSLELFERSRGRTPNVYFFNADAEERIGAGTSFFHPNKFTSALISDLEWLIAFAARLDDVVVLRQRPPDEFLRKISAAGFVRPEIETLDSTGNLRDGSLLLERKLHRFRPWSRSPGLEEVFESLSPLLNDNRGELQWTSTEKSIFSKAEQMQHFPEWNPDCRVISNISELDQALSSLNRSGWKKAMLKRPFAAAGKGQHQVFLDTPLPGPTRKAVESVIKKQGSIVIEPFHSRILDFSIQYEMKGGRLRFLGPIHQLVDPAGRYRGSESRVKFCRGLSPEISKFLMTEALPTYHPEGDFFRALEDWARSHNYDGPLGVDAYLYEGEREKIEQRVFCEINPRFTMGRITLEIRKQVAPGRNVRFEIVKPEDLQPADDSFQCNSKGLIESGSMVITPLRPSTRFAAKITVAKE